MAMSREEKEYIETAIDLCKVATTREVTLMIICKQENVEDYFFGDIIVTNAKTADMIAAMNGNGSVEGDSDE